MTTSADSLMWSGRLTTTASTSSSDSDTGSFANQSLLSGEDYLTQGDVSDPCLNQGTQLRDEIRCSIIQKRIQKGLGGIRLDWKANGQESLSKEEEAKRRQRRERNRVAASRCRERRRERTFVLVEETDQLESSKQDLLDEIDQLEEQKSQLLAVLTEHDHSGQCHRHAQAEELHIDP
ncbi:proto-oncogene c-Fos-like [Strongylocentrotus purpuratus]|uniref:BZIP domain-containing protein n=1 Tax=Strongylocentrotus purpuratus TaxID=7668 RepID=A0A7M7N6K3_STRPU|nr:proto-oncogene c-Fos [Strongylocentrotus purpuratus]XP_030831892.1 proto-oncogene c-Fos-like [Strongylocentrotus purpuratus]|eukprot:XP_003725798.1 PREDICTED: proto-oncogene c-Fos [Strongylocentrotus purpuratus]